jgi:cell division protein FtsA
MKKTTLAIDIGSSKIVAVLAKNDNELNINILGTGISKSSGIFKGAISNIEEATTCVNYTISLAKKTHFEEIDNTIVSISSKNSKSIRSSGSINIPNGIVTETEINQVLQMAIYNASIIPEYEVINAIPIYFKIDDMEIKNPLNINGTRLEVFVYIITVKKTTITNLRTVLKDIKTNTINFVVDGYASSLALLNEHQKNFGTSVINLGATITEIACFKNSSLLYNGFIPIGSNNITNDLSIMLHTPTHTAERIKLEYISLTKDYTSEQLNQPKIKIPRIADEESSSEIGLDYIQTIVHARVEEILILARNQLKKSASLENSNSGIIITGGLSNLGGIKELASKVFEGFQVSISFPKNLKNGYLDFSDPTYSTIVGLLYYGLDSTRVYQLDSNKILVRPIRIEVIKQPTIDTSPNKPNQEQNKPDVLTPIPRPREKLSKKIWKKIVDAF